MEKNLQEQIQEYLDTNNILYPYQSGFHPYQSTDTCLSYLSGKIIPGFEKGISTGMIPIDIHTESFRYDRPQNFP